jgi:hypothetical protein
VLGGTWGVHAAPAIVSFAASEAGKPGVGLNDGDIITLTFDKETNMQDVSSHSALQSLLKFSASIGDMLSGEWRDAGKVLVIQVVSSANSAIFSQTAVGTLNITVRQSASILSQDLSSSASISSAVLSGTWGTAPDAPLELVVFGSVTHSRLPLSWSAPLSDGGAAITSYKISYTMNEVAQPSRTIDGRVTSYILSGLPPNSIISNIFVQAQTYLGLSLSSNAISSVVMNSPGVLSISAASVRVESNDGKTQIVSVTVSRSGGSNIATAVQYRVLYESQMLASGKIRFGVGDSTRKFSFTVDGNSNVFDSFPDKSILAELYNPSGGAILGSPSKTHITIEKNQKVRDTFDQVASTNELINFHN